MLIIIACTGFGFSKNWDLKNHLKSLETLRQAFYMMRGELQYTRAAFEEIFEKVGDKIEAPIGKWLQSLAIKLHKKEGKSFGDIWQASIDQELGESDLRKEDLEELKALGKSLEHFENIDLYIEQLEYKIRSTRESYKTKGKLYKSFGIMGGVFLVILLL